MTVSVSDVYREDRSTCTAHLLERALERVASPDEGMCQAGNKACDGGNRFRHNGEAGKLPWQLHDTPIENQRPIRVIVIGAGYSGIYCGIRIPERLRNCELVIYEKNNGIGGTWYETLQRSTDKVSLTIFIRYENRYPGAACDIPSHSYQYSFSQKPDWSTLYAPSSEIREYLEQTAQKYGADRFIKLGHKVEKCTWNPSRGKWLVEIHASHGEEKVIHDECDVLISARGLLNNKQWPTIKGWESFKGEVMHSADWNETYDFTNKRIGIIGSGSSAIQIVPVLQKTQGAQLNCFVRNKVWITPPFGQMSVDALALGDQLDDGFNFSAQQIELFKSRPDLLYRFRMKLESDANNIHASTLKGSALQKEFQAAIAASMKANLAEKPEYYEYLKPDFAPGCRRLTPGPGFLEALVEENVQLVRDKISCIEPTGIVTEDGKLHEIDVLVCATGFSAAPSVEIVGLDRKSIKDHWHRRPLNYLSLTTNQFPNLFFMLGPNGAIGEGSQTMMIESTGDYIVRAIRKIQKENILSMAVRAERVREFALYCDHYFSRTVYKDNCTSWYRKNGQGNPSEHVTGLWPGSTLHCIEALRSPRWEDYEYEYLPGDSGVSINALGWLGNGWAMNQLKETPEEDALAWYLMPRFQEQDIGVPVPERPEEKEEYRLRPWSH